MEPKRFANAFYFLLHFGKTFINRYSVWISGAATLIRRTAIEYILKVKVKFSRYRPGVAQRVGRGIALLFHDRGTRRG